MIKNIKRWLAEKFVILLEKIIWRNKQWPE